VYFSVSSVSWLCLNFNTNCTHNIIKILLLYMAFEVSFVWYLPESVYWMVITWSCRKMLDQNCVSTLKLASLLIIYIKKQNERKCDKVQCYELLYSLPVFGHVSFKTGVQLFFQRHVDSKLIMPLFCYLFCVVKKFQ
jgi:hypothetical protein